MLTHRPMKNKAGTAAGNPRARADRASPTMNGNPNAQVCSVCFDAHVHYGHRHICIHLTLFLSFLLHTIRRPASHFYFFPHCRTGCVFFCTFWFRALVLVAVAGVVSQVLGFGPLARALALPRCNCSGRAPSG